MARFSYLFFYLLMLSLLGSQPLEPAGAKTTSILQDDLTFAENLARHSYFDLACDYADQILTRDLTLKDRQTVLLTKARIFAYQAEHEGDDAKKQNAFDQAIKSLKGILGSRAENPADHLLQVELAGFLCKLGQFSQEAAARSPMPQEASNLKKKAEDAFREGVALLTEAAQSFRRLSEAQAEAGDLVLAADYLRQAHHADYRKGVAHYHWAQLYGKETFWHADYLDQSMVILNDYAWEMFSEEYRGQWAYLYLSMASQALGNLSDALDYALAVVSKDSSFDLLESMRRNEKQRHHIQDLLESAYLQAAKIHNDLGNYEKTYDLVDRYRSQLGALGIKMDTKGMEAVLEQARACYAMDGLNDALEITGKITQKSEGKAVDDKAKILLSHLVMTCLDREEGSSDGSRLLSPASLIKAAQGAEIDKNYFQAIHLYLRVIRSLKNGGDADPLTGRCYLGMGQCFLRMHRYLEASVAFEIGFTGDNSHTDQATLAALGYHWFLAAEQRLKQTHDHPFDIARYNQIRDILQQSGCNIEYPPANNACITEADLNHPLPPFGSEDEAVALLAKTSAGKFGAKYRRRQKRGGGAATQRAVEWGLYWLKSHQDPRGFWDCDGFSVHCTTNQCPGKGQALNDVGVTGLALLAYLGYGNTTRSGPYQAVVRNGLKYLCDVQNPEDGCLGTKESAYYMYNHAIACLALTEGYGLAKFPPLKRNVDLALQFIHETKNPGRAWRYNSEEVDPIEQNDISVTSWMVQCLAAAHDFGLSCDERDLYDTLLYIDDKTDSATGRTGYKERGLWGYREAGDELIWPHDKVESMTAAGMFSRVLCHGVLRKNEDLDSYQSEMLDKGAKLLRAKSPEWNEFKGTIDYYYWYYGTYAMYQMAGQDWKVWKDSMIRAVVENQRTDGCEKGSWDPQKDPWGDHGGRVYSTALAVLTLEVFYRFDTILGPR